MDQSIDFESSLRAMTIWAALSNFEENDKGSLENGKKADFVVFNRDLKYLDSKTLEFYKVDRTFVNGQEVYSVKD
jgi:predicted amidohydrolase YtcJ